MARAGRRLSWAAGVTVAALAFAPAAWAQSVVDSAFCRSVLQNRCRGLIADRVRGADLPLVDGKRTVFFWANLQSAGSVAVDILMVRQGVCYPEDVRLGKERLSEGAGFFRTSWNIVLSGVGSVGDQVRALGLTEVGGAGVNLKINPVKISKSDEFRAVPRHRDRGDHRQRWTAPARKAAEDPRHRISGVVEEKFAFACIRSRPPRVTEPPTRSGGPESRRRHQP